jgi:mono/diheme cytochrome c family protein
MTLPMNSVRWPFAAILLAACAVCAADEAPDMTGAELFRTFCASCHGVDARGNGPVASRLKSKVPDLTRIAARNGGTFPKERVRKAIDGQTRPPTHGLPDMPVWGWEFYARQDEDAVRRQRVEELVMRLVDYLQTTQHK